MSINWGKLFGGPPRTDRAPRRRGASSNNSSNYDGMLARSAANLSLHSQPPPAFQNAPPPHARASSPPPPIFSGYTDSGIGGGDRDLPVPAVFSNHTASPGPAQRYGGNAYPDQRPASDDRSSVAGGSSIFGGEISYQNAPPPPPQPILPPSRPLSSQSQYRNPPPQHATTPTRPQPMPGIFEDGDATTLSSSRSRHQSQDNIAERSVLTRRPQRASPQRQQKPLPPVNVAVTAADIRETIRMLRLLYRMELEIYGDRHAINLDDQRERQENRRKADILRGEIESNVDTWRRTSGANWSRQEFQHVERCFQLIRYLRTLGGSYEVA